MKDKGLPNNKWLKKRGFIDSPISSNQLYLNDDISLCIDVEVYKGEENKEGFSDVCTSLFCDMDGTFMHLDVYTKKQIKDLHKALTGNKLKTIKL